MTQGQIFQTEAFKAAKQIALTINNGCYRRASLNGKPVNFCGYKDNAGRSWVIGDTSLDLQHEDVTINGLPARRVYKDFTVLSIN